MNLKDKVIVVTGAGSGIGRALVFALLNKGARVCGADMNAQTLEETKKLLPLDQQKDLFTQVLNIAELQEVEKLPDTVRNHFGQVDGIINNAGIIQPFIRINDLKYDTIEKIMQVNFYGMLYMTKSFLPVLLQRSESCVVNISSMGGFIPVPGQAVYGAAKAAVKLFSEALVSELDGSPVHVTVVFPGAVATNIVVNSGVDAPMQQNGNNESAIKALQPEIAASIIIDAIEKNKQRVFVGSDSSFLDKLYRLSPGYAMRLINKQMKQLLKR